MANSNFLIAVPPLTLDAFMAQVVDASTEVEGILLTQAPEVNGRCEVWRLCGRIGKRRISVSAYDSGSVCFQGISPKKLKLGYKVIKGW
jgi:hypothetical protein